MSVLPLARKPYARLQDSAINAAVNRELAKIEAQQLGVFVPKVLVFARSPYTVLGTDWLLLCDCTAGAITLTFPAAATVDGLHVVVVKTDASANAVTLSGTFSGTANPTITQQYGARIIDAGNGVYYLSPTDISGTAGKVANALTAGTHLTGGPYDGSAAVTLATDATAAHTASTLVARDANSRTALDGVQFPATQSPSSDANCLDDYEEGTWTATDASGAGLSITTNDAIYTKIGRVVVAAFNLTYPATADGSNATVGGLPYSALATTTSIGGGPINQLPSGMTFFARNNTGAATFLFPDTAGGAVLNSQLSGKSFRGVITYMAA